MHPLVLLAKATIEEYVKTHKVLTLSTEFTEEMRQAGVPTHQRNGVFVSIKKHGNLRGCIGTFLPTTNTVAEEIIQNAISAATQDPRFAPIDVAELNDITYSVDVLSTPQKIKDLAELDHKKYGVIVSKGYRKGLLLPDLEGVNSVSEQLQIAKYKAQISIDDEDVEIHRFSVRRYK
ncbi:MAG: AmmeMemoRadiSam system protein A [Candidatus Magnetoovum sp. WYHC-5]|nr:AmmeMemoRadiSam system protein A [Candidatus Magnetoovum sp. WYHC-5]